jgi:hypothetical protein
MSSFLYPVLNQQPNRDWIFDMLEDWKNSGKHYLEFSFSWFTPHTLPSNLDEVFWMYLYNTRKAADENLRRVVKYRVRVVQHSPTVITGNSIHISYEDNPDATMWFKCDRAEELRNKSGGLIMGDDFEHATPNTQLFPAIKNSIAPVKLKATSSLVVVGTTGNYQIA